MVAFGGSVRLGVSDQIGASGDLGPMVSYRQSLSGRQAEVVLIGK